jgi:hypothetical protein
MWNTSLVSLHVGADCVIGAAYVAIALTLWRLVLRARKEIPFHWMFLAFGTFILACGPTHFMDVWTIWTPAYWLSGAIKVITAVASAVTALCPASAGPQNPQLGEGRSDFRRAEKEID